MYTTNLIFNGSELEGQSAKHIQSQINKEAALKLYRSVSYTAGIRSLVGKVLRSRHYLQELASTHAGKTVTGSSYAGIRPVSIKKITGSESRSADFDADFLPLHERTRDRWISIAKARLSGRGLPPVELVQVGDAYYVRDGHHRISVARALGEEAIDAQVTVLRVDETLPLAA
jgi:hypothetical protein